MVDVRQEPRKKVASSAIPREKAYSNKRGDEGEKVHTKARKTSILKLPQPLRDHSVFHNANTNTVKYCNICNVAVVEQAATKFSTK